MTGNDRQEWNMDHGNKDETLILTCIQSHSTSCKITKRLYKLVASLYITCIVVDFVLDAWKWKLTTILSRNYYVMSAPLEACVCVKLPIKQHLANVSYVAPWSLRTWFEKEVKSIWLVYVRWRGVGRESITVRYNIYTPNQIAQQIEWK